MSDARRSAWVVVAAIAAASVASAQPRTPPVQHVTLGAVQADFFGDTTPQQGPYGQQGERATLSYDQYTSQIVRGSEAVLAPARSSREITVRDRRIRVCGSTAAVQRERIVRQQEMSSWWADGTNEHIRAPGPAEVIVAFDVAGEHYAAIWSVADHRRRPRYRALERRFFASIRCTP